MINLKNGMSPQNWPDSQVRRNDDIGLADRLKQETVAINFKIEELHERFTQVRRFEVLPTKEEVDK